MEVFTVSYQRLWFDYLVADGIAYTPAQLRKAGMAVKHGDEEEAYFLVWPGGTPRPPRTELRIEGSPGHWHVVRYVIEEDKRDYLPGEGGIFRLKAHSRPV